MVNIGAAVVSFLSVCVVCIIAAPAGAQENKATKDAALLLVKLLEPLKEISDKAEALGDLVAKVTEGKDMDEALLGSEFSKRQGAWDMDYGWGGGRFGKRGEYGFGGGRFGKRMLGEDKRYDPYGIGGRFGRDVSRVRDEADVKLHK